MDINKILDKMIEKYKLYGEIDYLDYKKVVFLIKEFLCQIPKESKIAIRGGGEHTKYLLEILEELKYIDNITCIIDKELKQMDGTEYKCISVDDIYKYNIDVIIISSYQYRKEMTMELYNLDKVYEIIDIYDYLYLNNINIQGPFYLYSNDRINRYDEIFLYRKKYLKEKNLKLKEFYLKNLIFNYLSIRDFVYSIKYINEYIENKYKKYEVYKKFLNELNLLLNDIKVKLSGRHCKDIILNWVDNLCYEELDQMNYLYKISKESMFFENAFTFTPWTTDTVKVMMTNKKTIDNHLFEIGKIDSNNSCVLKFFKENNYTFKYIGPFKDKIFDTNFSDNNTCYYATYNNWLALRNLILIDKPCFFIIHTLYETHEPFVSGEDTLLNLKYYKSPIEMIDLKNFRKQKIKSAMYIDKQIEWLDNILNDKCIRIYMSDHGCEKLYKDRRIHTILFIKGKDIINITCKKMFSYLNFNQLFIYLLEPSNINFEKVFTNFIEFQTLDYYGDYLVDLALKEKGKIFSLSDAISFRGIRTEVDKYILYATGDEFYFVLPDEITNEINNSKYKDRINKLRELTGNYFINICNYNKFKRSREIYNILEKIKINFSDEVIHGEGQFTNY